MAGKGAIALIVLGISGVLPGCTANIREMGTRMDELDVRCQSLTRANSSLRSRVDDLENRVLLLQDELETQRLMGMRMGTSVAAGTSVAKTSWNRREDDRGANDSSVKGASTVSLPVVKLAPPAGEDFVAGSDTSEPVTSDYGQDAYEPGPPPIDGGSLDIGDSYAGIDDMGRVIQAPSRNTSKGHGGRKSDQSRSTTAGKNSTAAVTEKTPTRKADDSREGGRPDRRSAARALDDYKAAYSLYNEGRLDEAREAFVAFVERYPTHAYADNARYWVGECWYDRRDFDKARIEFMKVISDYPDGNKVPDAMVKVGLSDQNLGRNEDARRMYDAVILTYPDSDAAGVAMKLIGRLQ